jgi:hypothetical protein
MSASDEPFLIANLELSALSISMQSPKMDSLGEDFFWGRDGEGGCGSTFNNTIQSYGHGNEKSGWKQNIIPISCIYSIVVYLSLDKSAFKSWKKREKHGLRKRERNSSWYNGMNVTSNTITTRLLYWVLLIPLIYAVILQKLRSEP